MKHIKPYRIFESQKPEHPGFPETKEEIERLCLEYEITDYEINDDLSLDVYSGVGVYLSKSELQYLPLNFNYVWDDFICSNNNLISLKGAPNTVSGSFSCSNNNLISLEGAPKKVDSHFFCYDNQLSSLKGCPEKINGYISCSNNNIMSLEYLPNGIDFNYYTSFEENPIYTLIYTFIESDNTEDLIQEFNDYSIVRGDKVILDRLKIFINDFDLEMPDIYEVKKYYKIV